VKSGGEENDGIGGETMKVSIEMISAASWRIAESRHRTSMKAKAAKGQRCERHRSESSGVGGWRGWRS
jgi:hypothetical protein